MGGGSLTPIYFCTNLLVRVKLGNPLNFNFLGKPLLREKYVEGRKKKERRRRRIPSLVATTSALASTTCACARTTFAPNVIGAEGLNSYTSFLYFPVKGLGMRFVYNWKGKSQAVQLYKVQDCR